jgi:serine/threonine protein kinase
MLSFTVALVDAGGLSMDTTSTRNPAALGKVADRSIRPSWAQAGASPIPGYHLVKRLGAGSFGEVWLAVAPGGLHKAIKIVRGTIKPESPGTNALAMQELSALKRVQAIRHPYLLSLERYDIIQGHLVVVMELADQNLWQRFKECRAQGLPGIPRAELLGYMAEAAEALDLMNLRHGLQHQDIKPENLFLVHHHIKVADFGLVNDLNRFAPSDVGGTPAYVPPESFRGTPSRFSDQYSLAIVFQELLTGQRPFVGTECELRQRHLAMLPNLVPLPQTDRPVLARALAKKPEQRFPSSRDLVEALRAATASTVTNHANGPFSNSTEAPTSSDTVVETACPGCGFKGRAPIGCAGRTLACRNCGRKFMVPAPETPKPVGLPDEIDLCPLETVVEAPVKTAPLMVPANCPKCHFTGAVPLKFIARRLKCRQCRTEFMVQSPGSIGPRERQG